MILHVEKRCLVVIAILTFSLTSGGALADCTFAWRAAPSASDLNGTVHALVIWNGDLVAGGAFTTAGGTTVNGIARWDGVRWSGSARA